MARQLTAAAVMRLKPGKERRQILDGGVPGLYLQIQPSGHKSWIMRFRRPDGAQAKLTLGRADVSSSREPPGDPKIGGLLTLAAARQLAAEVNRQRAQGHDVVANSKRVKFERHTADANTFARAAVDFVEQHAKRETRGWRETTRVLGLHADGAIIPKGLVDRWHDRAVAEISADEVHALIEEVRHRGVPGLERRANGPTGSRARTTFAILSKMFAWLVQQRRLGASPCVGVHRPQPPRPRDRVLSASEIKSFWLAASGERGEFAAVLKLLLLLGQRLGEVRGMRRAEFSDDGAVWTIPGERTKNRRTHVVPLPALARQIIADAGGNGDFVFSTTGGRAPVSIGSKIKKRLDTSMKASAPWREHDLRRTCATGMAEQGVAPHIVEAVLNHVSGHRAGVAGIYNRAQYTAEKKAALELWAKHVDRLVNGRMAKVAGLLS
jgi:integrase